MEYLGWVVDLGGVCVGEGESRRVVRSEEVVRSCRVSLGLFLLFFTSSAPFDNKSSRRSSFVTSDRPYPVHASLLSFFFPPVPFLPSLRTGSSSDETLAIRTLFTALKIAFTWTVLSLVTGELSSHLLDHLQVRDGTRVLTSSPHSLRLVLVPFFNPSQPSLSTS